MQGIDPTPGTDLGRLRAEMAHARAHQERVAGEWDRTLQLIRTVDFEFVGPGEVLEDIRGMVEIWSDLTLEPPRRIASLGQLEGLPSDGDERYEYMHRVLVGLDPPAYLAMCDAVEGELDTVVVADRPVPMPELRDRIVELMELGVRCSTRAMEWLDMRVRKAEGHS
jgi:hypothetical protein